MQLAFERAGIHLVFGLNGEATGVEWRNTGSSATTSAGSDNGE
jgi:hypothetical protein